MGNLATLTFPITKRTQEADGSIIVEGAVTDDSLDLDGQIVDAKSAAKALQNWFDDYANVRQQHSPILAPAGKGLSLIFRDGVPILAAKIVEPTAIKLVKADVYQSYSIGIGDGTLDTSPTAKRRARNGILYPSLVNEVSIVDYPANTSIGKFTIAKRRKDGTIRDVSKVSVTDESLRHLDGDSLVAALKGARDAGAIVYTAASDDEASALIGTQFPSNDYEADGNVIVTKRSMDPNVGGGVDRDKIPGKDFAGKDRSFPIVKPGDVSDAAASIGRAGSDNYDSATLKANIIRIAQRKGPEFVAELPKKWRKEMGQSQKSKKAPGSTKPFEGAAPPFGSDERANDDSYTVKDKAKKKKAKKAKKSDDSDKIPETDQAVTEDLEKTDDALSQAKDDQEKDNEAHVNGDDESDEKSDDEKSAKAEKGHKKKISKAAQRLAKESAKARATAKAMKRAHDALCPLYKESVTKSLTSVISPELFRERLAAADQDNVETFIARSDAYSAASHIATLKKKDVNSLRKLAHKAFTDAYPDVHVASPDLSDPSSFQRRFLPSANSEVATSTSHADNFVDAKPLSADQFTRGPLTVNEARPTLSSGVSAASLKSRQFYTNADKDRNSAAMATLHDHIVDNYPSVCPASTGLANETSDRLGTPPEMYSPASHAVNVDTKGSATLAAVSSTDTARAIKRAVNKAVKPLVVKNKKQAKKIAKLKKSIRKELAQPDYSKAAHRRTDFAAAFASDTTPVSESKRERLERAKMLSGRIHDRYSGVLQDEISELQELVTPAQYASMMLGDE